MTNFSSTPKLTEADRLLPFSALGFGLSSIAGSGNFRHQEKLIRTAIDCGVTHFDVAPFYGSGDAEIILGKVLANCSEDVTIITKYGIIPTAAGGGGRLIRSLLRPVFRKMQGLKSIATRVMAKAGNSSEPVSQVVPGSIKESVEASLAKLGRPIDAFLLHDVTDSYALDQRVISELRAVASSGSVRATGLSGDASSLRTVIDANTDVYRVLQMENSLRYHEPLPDARGDTYLITHRALQGGLDRLTFLLHRHPRFREIWTKRIAGDSIAEEQLPQVLIELALHENSGGTVLFSTTKPERIRELSLATRSPLLNGEQCQRLRKLVQDVSTTAKID